MFCIEKVRIGVELEFYANRYNEFLSCTYDEIKSAGFNENFIYSYDVRNTKGNNWWLTTDSIDQNEISSPILRYDEIDQIRKLTHALKKSKYKIKSNSGMHVHLSYDGDVSLNYNKFVEEISRRYKKYVWPQRMQFCYPDKFDSYYAPVRRRTAQSHIEIRVYNGTFNYITIKRRIMKAIEIYGCCLCDVPSNISKKAA